MADPAPDPKKPKPRIVVCKFRKTLELFAGDKLFKSFPAVTGLIPTAKKRAEEPMTPEGDYHVCTKDPKGPPGPSLGISFPNRNDARRAFYSGLITRDQRQAIFAAAERGEAPPWDTPLGGGILIYGAKELPGGTDGNIAIPLQALLFMYPYIPLGTAVTIKE